MLPSFLTQALGQQKLMSIHPLSGLGDNSKGEDLNGQKEENGAVKPHVSAPPLRYFHLKLKECDSNQGQVNLHLHIFLQLYKLGNFNIKKNH